MKIAILGASYLQRPLVQKAKELGIETHVFAWNKGNVVNDISDFYYPISILDKEEILVVCSEVGIDAIISIASDIAMPSVNFIANKLGLIGNSIKSSIISTDKYEMRKALSQSGMSCPNFSFFDDSNFIIKKNDLNFPIIVKPTDRSGSRGVTMVEDSINVNPAITKALKHSFKKSVIVEEFIEGREFSIEIISFKGKHYPLAITDKVTTGAPFFVETEHHQPADISKNLEKKIFTTISRALDILEIKNGASHSEIIITEDLNISIVEVAARMGGDFIGSDLVMLSRGYDFLKGVIDVALNQFTFINYSNLKNENSGVYFVIPKSGKIVSVKIKSDKYNSIVKALPIINVGDHIDSTLDGSEKRAGIIVYAHPNEKQIINPNDVIKFEVI